MEKENLHSRFSYTLRRNRHQVSWFRTSRTSRLYQDTQTNHEKLLVSASKVWWPELSQLSLCSEFDKENSMEFLLISLLLIHFTTVAIHLLSHGPHVTLVMWHTVTCDMIIRDHPSHQKKLWHCDKVTWYFPTLHLVVVSPIRKEKKRKGKEI